jgi:hypothetical protein
MSDTKKPRAMTVKMFLHRSSGKISAAAFLTQYRSFLENGDLAEVTSPILRMWDEEQLMPTPALDLLKSAVLTHHLRVECDKAERRLDEGPSPSSHSSKSWVARIFDAKGNLVETANTKGEIVELEMMFDMASDADRWTDRRLFEGAPDWFGVVQHTSIMRADGEPITSVIMRDDAIARILKRPASAATKKMGKGDGKLSFGVKVSQSRATFSHG